MACDYLHSNFGSLKRLRRVGGLGLALLLLGGCDSDDEGSNPWRGGVLTFGEETIGVSGTTTETQDGLNIRQTTQRFELSAPLAPTQRWTQRTSGLCGQKCRNGPRHMYSTAFEDTLLVSWMAVDEEDPWRHYGNVATFTVAADGTFTLEKNVSFDGLCEATYGIAANDDGSVIAVLCRGEGEVTTPYPEAINLLDNRRKEDCTEDWQGRCYPIGNYSAHDSALYIMEFRGGGVDATPDDMVYVNHAVGGWRYGHHEIMLNSAEDTYFLNLKVTAGPSADNRHEGLTHFAVQRTPEWSYVRVTDEWGCGSGHVTANRTAYNAHEDTWAKMCMLDSCRTPSQYANKRCNALSFYTVPGVTGGQGDAEPVKYEGDYILELDQGDKSWNMPGGVGGLLSLGEEGWLALAAGPGYPGAEIKPDAIGLLKLPKTLPELQAMAITEQVPEYAGGEQVGEQESIRYQWNWLHLPEPDPELGRERRFGVPAMAYFCTEGETCERLLLGWSPSIAFQGLAEEYVVSEIDRDGQLRGETFTLRNAGWGEDNRWQTMPNSGCVVFPFSWTGDAPGKDYPIERPEMASTDFPSTLYMTSLCPTGEAQPELAPSPPAMSDSERWPAP